MPEISVDEIGNFWVFDDEGEPYAGPYATPQLALEAHPEADYE